MIFNCVSDDGTTERLVEIENVTIDLIKQKCTEYLNFLNITNLNNVLDGINEENYKHADLYGFKSSLERTYYEYFKLMSEAYLMFIHKNYRTIEDKDDIQFVDFCINDDSFKKIEFYEVEAY